MPGISELATVMMSAAQRRMTVTAANLGNVSTPSFRAQRVFSQVLDLRNLVPVDFAAPAQGSVTRALKFTGGALDVAAAGQAVLLMRDGEHYAVANSVQLRRDADGRLVDMSGRALQAAGGGDLVIGPGTPAILADGTILIDGQAAGRVGLFALPGGPGKGVAGAAAAGLEPAGEGAVVHQGYLVPADVDPATEMIELTRAGRLAETGARVFQIHDELLGQAASKLGDLR